MNEIYILTMNSRPPMRKFVTIFLCCVTLLELVGKKTFGLSKVSFRGKESKCFSLFSKVKEGMFKRQLHDRSNSFCILRRNLLALDKKYTHFAY